MLLCVGSPVAAQPASESPTERRPAVASECCVRAASAPAPSGLAAAPLVGWVFDTSPYPPRWRCGQWAASIGWLHILSDLGIWLAYSAIPLALLWFARNRADLPFRGLWLLFVAFILLCGATHLMEAIIFYWPAYGLAGVLKFVTAVVSLSTAVVLVRVAPVALALRSPEDLEAEVRQRTRELEFARAEAELVVESSPTGIVMIDEQGTIIKVNAVTEHQFGAPREQLLGRPVEVLLPERYREDHPQLRREFLVDPVARNMGVGRELYARRANGEEFPVEVGLQPVRTSRGMCVISAIVDISERSAMQSQLAAKSQELACANAALRRSNEELESFAFVASHDLQEPLRKISSYCQLLKEDKSDQLDEESQEYLDVAINGAERLRVLVRDLLSFSRIATHGEELAPTDANACLQGALEQLDLTIEETGAEILVEPLPVVRADASQLTLLLQNLIGNALKYRGEETPRVRVSAAEEGDRTCVISVEDNGIGVPEEFRTKIFQIFQRLHTRHRYSGTGIGLALCKRVADRFGGDIWVESAGSQGSVFKVRLRLAAQGDNGSTSKEPRIAHEIAD